MRICGIDPGLSGAVCFLDSLTGTVEIFDMPTLALGKTTKRSINEHTLADIFWKAHAGHCYVEQAWPRPTDSGPGGFSVGVGFGVIRGVLAAVGVPFTVVSPQKWKRSLGVVGDKDNSRSRASQLLPQAATQWPLKKHDGRAESALIAYFGHRELSSIALDMPSVEDAEFVASAVLALDAGR